MLLLNGRLHTPAGILERGTIVSEAGRIVEVRPTAADDRGADLGGRDVVPGFIDIHVHGAVGCDVMDATPEALHKLSLFYASRGVSGFLPTTLTANVADTRAAVENIRRCPPLPGARILGIHLEGPYLNRDFPGAQSPEHIRPADPGEYSELFGGGHIRLLTLAPEVCSQNRDLISYAVKHGCAVAIGHSGATYAQVLDAISLGANQATHTFNGMRGLHHREPGTAGAVLALDELYAQIIVDFVHVHPAVVKLLVRAKGTEKTVLISDAMRATALPDGDYTIGEFVAEVREGVAHLQGHADTLAGSTLTMDAAVRNVMTATGLSLWECQQMASLAPANAIGLGSEVGRIARGYRADLTVLDPGVRVHATIVGGQTVFGDLPYQ
jgi:N-acetylglucosamine-6-phosphate deacetylase